MSVKRLRAIAMTTAAAIGAACGPRSIELGPAPAIVRPCEGDSRLVTWRRAPDPSERLGKWCESVGEPVVIAAAPRQSDVRRLLIISWNVHVGGGRVKALVDLVLARMSKPAGGDVGVVLILQEVFRAGSAVPDRVRDPGAVPAAIRSHRPSADVAELARSMGMSAAYVPSMRNGPSTDVQDAEDRGSAILTTESLGDITAIELPFGRQRRVAVMATVTPAGSGSPLHVIAGHLDPIIGGRRQAEALARYIDELKAAGEPVILGIDTNALRGRADSAVRTLERSLPIEACGKGRTGSWLARVDFIFSSLPEFRRTCETFSERHGSDHAPLLLTVDY